MYGLSNQGYLRQEQYRNSRNLQARIDLHARFSSNRYGWQRWIFDQIAGLPAKSRILEVGCGPGNLWSENEQRLPSGWRLMLSDFSPGMLQEARENLLSIRHQIAFAVLDAQKIPFGNATFDAVVANHMLYHVPDRPATLAEIWRVLKPGGLFYASTIGRNHLREIFQFAGQFAPEDRQWQGHQPTSFLLENGEAQLSPWFTNVQQYRYEDELEVTEAEPLIAYIASMTADLLPDSQAFEILVAFIKSKIASEGRIRITKASGLFVSSRRPGVRTEASAQ